ERVAIRRERQAGHRLLIEQVGDVRLQIDRLAATELELVRDQQIGLVEHRRATQVAAVVEVDRHALVSHRRRLEQARRGKEVQAEAGAKGQRVRTLQLELH